MTFRPFSASISRFATRLGVVVAVVAAGIGIGVGTSPASAQACDALNISTVAVERCVIPGHQPEIDAGHVVRVDDLSTSNGHWLAGHRSTHGSTFGPLTQMEIGDIVSYRGQGYEIVEYTTARFASPGHVLNWTKLDVPTVVLQTSVDDVSAHLWRAEAITVDQELVDAAIGAILAPFTSGTSAFD